MVRLELLFALVSICLLVFCLIEVIRTPEEDIRHLPKTMWLLLVLFFPFVGSVAWLIAGRPPKVTQRPTQRPSSGFSEYERPGRAAASNPDDDAEFLRQVKRRAEEQRRKLEEQRDREAKGEPPAGEA